MQDMRIMDNMLIASNAMLLWCTFLIMRMIHNTLEAAAWGMPVVFGPNYKKFKEACELIECGAGCSIKNYEECAQSLDYFFKNNNEASTASKEYVAKNTGATKLIYNNIFSN